MTRPRFHILRNVRLQLKGGYIKYEPAEYAVMKRLPPLTKSNDIQRLIKPVNVPYAGLYKKAVARNNSFNSDLVFGGFAHMEPQGLVMAKRQYQFIQEGLDEESAYKKALDYVGELENEAYMKMKNLVEAVKATGAEAPFVADPQLVAEIAAWQVKNLETPYEEMDEATQGELDYFIQIKLLKWNELERERRMKDIAFFRQFSQLLNSLFSISDAHKAVNTEKFKKTAQKAIFTVNDVDPSFLNTAKPFRLEEYLEMLQKAKAEPDLQNWPADEREEFSNWIVDKLAYGAGVIDKPAKETQQYLDDVRDRFFPMIRMPFIAGTFHVPTVDSVKALLYENNIGYKLEEDGKTFVLRSYLLPSLLFPEDLVVVQIATDKGLRLEEALDDSEALAEVLEKAGFHDDALLHATRGATEKLQMYRDHLALLSQREEEEQGEEISEMSVLDAILGSDSAAPLSVESEKKKKKEEEEGFYLLNQRVVLTLRGDEKGEGRLSKEERAALVQKIIRMPKTQLEQDRFDIFIKAEPFSVNDVANEHQAEILRESMEQSEVLMQSKLQRLYEDKETERRARDMEKRGVWSGDVEPSTPLLM